MDFFLHLFIGFAVLAGVVCTWAIVYYFANPQPDNPDGKARITGSCGDTMEIALTFDGERVKETSHWTDGCAYSLNCVYAAACLAKDKTPDEILEIDERAIQEFIGGLPSDHIHCARLAHETLQAALEDFMRNQAGKAHGGTGRKREGGKKP
ncbi:MAG: iron-sulfur cluster assembly scaffold protein [Deltaproteobacteria bacterium]|nr:iron-sulfur cluster assembly scaffold protein [Deltaproteobacteria bacterium]MBW2018292.1 iron-sulfur cluster assembly scaffold protein [Deltaproteobacteria bacterium]MBW2130811.1 iron-sulfur cluster assembly scaffold protein [Deltaproteobacteria bacterium]MBW2304607.1 iron-sulfur cluster assembly scaffold protein [Deltaproteobacteria bacterium]